MNNKIGCFDRIDHAPAIFTLTRYGMDYDSAWNLFCIIQKTMHTIKTRYVVSDPVYGNKIVPLAKCGQRNHSGLTL